MEKCKKITISGNEYPIRFDYTVLKEISEKYKSIREFEMKLLGLTVVGKDENGKEMLKKTQDASVSCIMFILPLMINSALDYSGYEQVDEKKIIREIDLNFEEIAVILHGEFEKCFKTSIPVKKKYNPRARKTVKTE